VARLRLPGILLAAYAAVLAATAWQAYDALTWLLEVAPALLAIPLLVATRRRAPLTMLLYILLFVHGCILAVGGHWTYARVPLGEWMKGWFGFERNHYDRIGHFAQGFVPAALAYEVLLRWGGMRRGWLLGTAALAVPMAVSALYEILEWLVGVATGAAGDAFLGTQGDVWDTQKDMATALLGAVAYLVLLRPWHIRAIATQSAQPDRPA
jgi:putative membrane protein